EGGACRAAERGVDRVALAHDRGADYRYPGGEGAGGSADAARRFLIRFGGEALPPLRNVPFEAVGAGRAARSLCVQLARAKPALETAGRCRAVVARLVCMNVDMNVGRCGSMCIQFEALTLRVMAMFASVSARPSSFSRILRGKTRGGFHRAA